jgi:uncharacterized ion transporter superfamily protein YfcC
MIVYKKNLKNKNYKSSDELKFLKPNQLVCFIFLLSLYFIVYGLSLETFQL